MSLKRVGMLRIEDQRAAVRESEPGADPGVFGSQRRGSFRGRETRGDLRVGQPHVAGSRVSATEPRESWIAAAVYGEADRAEPCTGDAADRRLSEERRSQSEELSAAPLCAPLYARRY